VEVPPHLATVQRPRRHVAILTCGALAVARAAFAAEPARETPRLRPLVGEERSVLVEPEDTLLDVAFRARLGFESVVRLNPGLDEWIPDPGSVVRLPTRFVLPDVEPDGLVLNVPEMRLYDFRAKPLPDVYAAAVGDPTDPTPLGAFRVGEKRIDPVWTVPASIRAEKPELPARVPPGPENPLGSYWMTIGTTSYGIHGTNVRWSIGRMATHGCVRLYEDQIQRLFERTPPGTRLRIVYQMLKWGSEGDGLYLEAHPDLYAVAPDPLALALATPSALGLLGALDFQLVARTVQEARGVPVRVGTLPPPAREPATSPPPS
jgi:L,D-transpeptidase ErfK/SrfK